MNSFERPAQPKPTSNTETAPQSVASQNELLTREHAYQAQYGTEILPLLREAEKLQIQLGVAEQRLRGAQISSPNQPEILALQKQLRALRGEPEPDTVPGNDSALATAELEYDTAKAALETKRTEITERASKLRRGHGLG